MSKQEKDLQNEGGGELKLEDMSAEELESKIGNLDATLTKMAADRADSSTMGIVRGMIDALNVEYRKRTGKDYSKALETEVE